MERKQHNRRVIERVLRDYCRTNIDTVEFKFIKDENVEELTQVTGGILTGDLLDAGAVEAVSKLPSLDELRGQIAGLIISPATGLVNVLHSATGQVVNVLQAYLDDRGAGDEGEAA